MPRKKLNDVLESLHHQLDAGVSLDETDRQHLAEVLREIKEVLDAESPHLPLVERINAMVQQLESEHPTLTAGLREVIQTLRQL